MSKARMGKKELQRLVRNVMREELNEASGDIWMWDSIDKNWSQQDPRSVPDWREVETYAGGDVKVTKSSRGHVGIEVHGASNEREAKKMAQKAVPKDMFREGRRLSEANERKLAGNLRKMSEFMQTRGPNKLTDAMLQSLDDNEVEEVNMALDKFFDILERYMTI